MRILILSRSENMHSDMVEAYCHERADVSRINFDFENTSPEHFPGIVVGTSVLMNFYNAIFVHHPRISYQDTWFADPIERKLFVASWDSVKEWFEAEMPAARWVNRPSANARSRNLLRQLKLAHRLGLATPDTLFTNNTDVLRSFAGSDEIVVKQGNLGVHLEGKRILTTPVNVQGLSQEELGNCPCLFQKYVPKAFELRIHVIGDSVLSCSIDSQTSAGTKIDWRQAGLERVPHKPHQIKQTIRERCVDLVREMGLEFGIIDMIVTPSGEHVFLECNAQGHWGWIERLTGLPVTETLCKHLLHSGSD